MPTEQVAVILHHLQKLTAPAADCASDQDLLNRYAERRDEDAFAALLRRHGPMVLRVCRRVLPHGPDAEDAFQVTFLTLARKAGAVCHHGSAAGWLFGVACNTARRLRDAAARRTRRERAAPARASADPLAEMSARELLGALDQELSRLPPKYREPLVLCYLEGTARDEAAQRLGCPLGTLKGRLERGKERLREALARRGLALAAGLAATLFGGAAEGAVPTPLARATLRAAALVKPAAGCTLGKLAAAFVVTLGLVTAGLGWGVGATPAKPQEAPAAARGEGAPRQAGARPPADPFGDPLPKGAVARLGTLRLRHGSMISSLAFTPDGKQLVSHGHFDGIRVWDVATGQELDRLTLGREGWMSSAALTPDGKTVITLEGTSGRVNSRVIRWRDRAGLKVRREIKAGDFSDLVLSPDGKFLLALERREAMELLDAATGKKLHTLRGHSWPNGQTFSADSKTLVTGGADGAIRFWDVATGAKKLEIAHPNIVGPMALSGDSKRLATVGLTEQKHGNGSTFPWDPFIRIWEVASGKEVRRLAAPEEKRGGLQGISAVVFAPDGKTLVSAGLDAAVRFWDLLEGKEVRRLDLGSRGAARLAFSPDGKTLALVGGTPRIRLLDVASGKPKLADASHPGGVHALVTPDGRTVVTISLDNVIRLWDAASGRERQRLKGHEDDLLSVQLAADGRTLFSAGADRTLRVWDLPTGKELRRLSGAHFARAWSHMLAVSPDGKWVVVPAAEKPAPDGGAKTCLLLDARTGKEIRRFADHKPPITGASFTPDGRTLVTWDGGLTVRLWDVATGARRKAYRLLAGGQGGLPGLAYAAVVSPDGKLIAECSQRRFLGLQELATGKEVRRFEGLPDGVCTIAFTRDGRMLAWGGWRDPTIHLVELGTGRERGTLVGHNGRVVSLAFSADGKTLVSGSEDTTALVWDLSGK